MFNMNKRLWRKNYNLFSSNDRSKGFLGKRTSVFKILLNIKTTLANTVNSNDIFCPVATKAKLPEHDTPTHCLRLFLSSGKRIKTLIKTLLPIHREVGGVDRTAKRESAFGCWILGLERNHHEYPDQNSFEHIRHDKVNSTNEERYQQSTFTYLSGSMDDRSVNYLLIGFIEHHFQGK